MSAFEGTPPQCGRHNWKPPHIEGGGLNSGRGGVRLVHHCRINRKAADDDIVNNGAEDLTPDPDTVQTGYYVQSCVKTFLLSFENHLKMFCCPPQKSTMVQYVD